MIHGFACDEQPHDFRRPFEDQIDAEIAHRTLDWNRRLAASTKRIGGLVAAAAANLQRIVDDAPAVLRVVHLCNSRFEANVIAAMLRESDRQAGDRLHGERIRCHHPDLLGNRLVLADGRSPLNSFVRPPTRNIQHRLRSARGTCWKR